MNHQLSAEISILVDTNFVLCNKRKDILSIGPEDIFSDVKIGIVKGFQQPMLIYVNRLSRIQIRIEPQIRSLYICLIIEGVLASRRKI